MTNKKLTITSVSLLALFLVATFAAFRQQAQDKTSVQNEEATLVQKGQVTEKEREYSKEFKKLYPYHKGRKLSELKGGTQDVGIFIEEPDFVGDPRAPIITPAKFLTELSCQADAVVLGYVKDKTAHLTEDETFVYTEYEFIAKNVLKSISAFPIQIDSSLQVTRPGGVVKLDNRLIRVEDKSFEPLEKNKEYLLFLRYIPSVKGYIVASDKGDFVLEGNSFKKLTKRATPKELEKVNRQNLLNIVKDVTSNDCNQNSTGGNQ